MPEPQVASASRKPKIIVAVALTLVLGGAGIFLGTRPAHTSIAAPAEAPVGSTLALETFVVNLNGAPRSYLRVGIALELSGPPAHDKDDMPVALVRDTILSVLSSTRPDQLTQSEGKTHLKGAIFQALKDRVPQLGAQDIYFTEFLVQM